MRPTLFAALLLAACATTRPETEDLSAYPAALVGTYDNSAQFAAAPEDMKRAPVADDSYDWIDLQRATFTTVNAPGIGPHVVYLEWRNADGAISRQRLWSFRKAADGVRMDFYTLLEPAKFAGQPADSAVFGALTAADVKGYGPACGLMVSSAGRGAWNAQITPEECSIVAASGREMGIDARVTVMPTGVLYQEAGRLPEGGYAFRVPGGQPYDFRRR